MVFLDQRVVIPDDMAICGSVKLFFLAKGTLGLRPGLMHPKAKREPIGDPAPLEHLRERPELLLDIGQAILYVAETLGPVRQADTRVRTAVPHFFLIWTERVMARA
jgi:hypothetical protein